MLYSSFSFIPLRWWKKKTMMFSIGSIIFEKVFDFIGSHDLKKIPLSYIEINLSLEQAVWILLARRR